MTWRMLIPELEAVMALVELFGAADLMPTLKDTDACEPAPAPTTSSARPPAAAPHAHDDDPPSPRRS